MAGGPWMLQWAASLVLPIFHAYKRLGLCLLDQKSDSTLMGFKVMTVLAITTNGIAGSMSTKRRLSLGFMIGVSVSVLDLGRFQSVFQGILRKFLHRLGFAFCPYRCVLFSSNIAMPLIRRC